MRVLRTVTVFLAWSLIVVAVAAGASLAVDSAGRAVGTADPPADVVLPPPPTSSPLAVESSSSRSPTVRGTPSPSRTSPTSSPSPSPSPAPSDTYTTEGGTVVLRCQGTAVLSWTVWPAADWHVDAMQKTISIVDFTFSARGRRSYARGTCRVEGPAVGTLQSPPSPTSP